jgi:type IX secretion system PorP/SprF family membrane protein
VYVIIDVLRRYLLTALLLLLAVSGLRAQYDPSFSHYWAMEASYNPAAAGKSSLLNVSAAYNMTMAGFKRNPKTMYVGADMPFYAIGSYHGLGAQLSNDAIGLFSHQKLGLQYAYKHQLLGGTLSVGVQGGLLSEKFDGSSLDLEEGGDLAFSTGQATGTGVDLGAGLYYTRGNWYVGASAQHLTAPTIELGETNELAISRTYYFTGGYNIRLRNPFLTIHTSVFGVTDGVAYKGQLTGRLKYTHEEKMMYAGVSYSPSNSVTLLLGGNFHGVTLGYSYEAYTTAINIGNGSHELFVGYQTELNLYKKGRNRHQSVRIL